MFYLLRYFLNALSDPNLRMDSWGYVTNSWGYGVTLTSRHWFLRRAPYFSFFGEAGRCPKSCQKCDGDPIWPVVGSK